MYRNGFKRVADILFSALLIPLFCIVFLIFAPVIFFEDKGSIFFYSVRVGKNKEVFKMIKFRTMKTDAPDIRNSDNSTYSDDNDERLTKIGRFLRKTSIDEVPQIINVLKGEMSIIGPRPILYENELEEYRTLLENRGSVRPGITGYSQAYYRNSIPQDEKFKHDIYYVDNISLLLDIKVLLKTASSVLTQRNIFSGTEKDNDVNTRGNGTGLHKGDL